MVFTFIIRHVVIIIESSQEDVALRHGHGSLHCGMCGGHGAILRNDDEEEDEDGTIVQW